jgi:hypothetical protein
MLQADKITELAPDSEFVVLLRAITPQVLRVAMGPPDLRSGPGDTSEACQAWYHARTSRTAPYHLNAFAGAGGRCGGMQALGASTSRG